MAINFLYNYSGIKFDDSFYYEKQLESGVNEILYPNDFDTKEDIEAINYFKHIYSKDKVILVTSKLISKYLIDFKNENKAINILKQECLRYIPVDEETLNIVNLSRFGDVYIKRMVRQDIIQWYKQVKNYSDFILEKII